MDPVPEQAETPTLPIHRDAPPAAVVLEQPASPPESKEEETPQTACPRCGSKLIDAQSLGWCSKCGYCRSLEEDAKKVLAVAAPSAQPGLPLGAGEFSELLQRLPRWSYILAGGALAVVVLSAAANLILPADSLARALWTTFELLFGLLCILAAQVWCLFILAPEDDKLGSKDIVFSVRLWSLTFKRLPEMCRQVWLGGWGASAVLSALFLVGGLTYWYQFYKPKKFAERSLVSAVNALAKGKEQAESLEEAVEDMAAKAQDLTKDRQKEDARPVEQCVIIGYTLDGKKNLTGLVLAGITGDEVKYLGQVKRGFTPEVSQEIVSRLGKLTRPDPLIPGLRLSAIWVQPELFCEVHSSGRGPDGLLVEPNFGALLEGK
jgi:ribosomal protein L37E